MSIITHYQLFLCDEWGFTLMSDAISPVQKSRRHLLDVPLLQMPAEERTFPQNGPSKRQMAAITAL